MTSAQVSRPDSAQDGTERKDTRRGRWWLAGAVAGPLFVLVSFAQVPFRDGFDLTRHAFSFLLTGPGGWLQEINFLVTGVLFLVAGTGLGRVVGRWARGAAYGLGGGLIVGGLFAPDPSHGYPIGAPAGMPDPVTYRSVVHGLGFVVGMLSWCVLLLVLARWFARAGRSGWAAVSLVTAIGLLAVPVVSNLSFGTVVLYLVATAGYGVTSVLFTRLRTA
jgi:hypothetical protein